MPVSVHVPSYLEVPLWMIAFAQSVLVLLLVEKTSSSNSSSFGNSVTPSSIILSAPTPLPGLGLVS